MECCPQRGGGLMAPLAIAGVSTFATLMGPSYAGYEGIFILPALVAILIAIISFILIRDTPQSVGLPPIEEYRNDFPNKMKKRLKQN